MEYFSKITGIKEIAKDLLRDLKIREEEDCGNDDLRENGIFDEYIYTEELPDEVFDEFLEMYSGDPCVHVLKENPIVNETVCSRIAFFDYNSDTIMTGSKEVEPLRYYIDHDLSFVEPGLEWYVDVFMLGKFVDFPFIHPAQVHIDRSKTKPEQHYQIQSHFMHRGYFLYNPTELERKHCDTYGGMMSSQLVSELDIKYDKSKKVFLSYRDVEPEIEGSYIAMQFNPFHVKSLGMITKVERIGMSYKGVYTWNGRDVNFNYDLLDTRYRVHSIDWQKFLGFANPAYEVFDLVSDHDFIDLFPFRQRDPTFDELAATVFIEPLVTNRIAPEGYSVIGPWPGDIRRGVSYCTYVPTLSKPVLSLASRDYEEVTHLCRNLKYVLSVRNHCIECVENKLYDDQLVCPVCDKDVPMYSEYDYNDTKDYYVLYNPFRVFVLYTRKDEVGKGTYIFYRFEGDLPTYPRNGKSSIMYEPRFLNLIDFFKVRKWRPEVSEWAAVTLHRMKEKYMPVNVSSEVVDKPNVSLAEEKLRKFKETAIVYVEDCTREEIEQMRDMFECKMVYCDSGGVNVTLPVKEIERLKSYLSISRKEFMILT